MKICLVAHEYPPETARGGIGTQTWTKAHALADLGHTVHVLSRSADRGPELRTDMDGPVTVHRMQPPGLEFPLYEIQTYWLGYSWLVLRQLSDLLERVPFDVIDFPEYGGEGFAYQLDRSVWNWAAVVVQLHGPLAMFVEQMSWPTKGSRFQQLGSFMEEFSIKRADALMACSANIADLTTRIYGVPRAAIDVVCCGVDARFFHPNPDCQERAERPTVLFVGNIVKNKGVYTLVEAVLRLRCKYPNIHLRFFGVGKPELIDELTAWACASGADNTIEFAQFTPKAALLEIYRRADVFCSPAEYEGGVANVYLEAMASGCPVVATTAGGGPEAVIDGQTGFLVPPNDAEATATALDKILGDARLRQEMAQAARRRVEEYFAMDKYVERVLAVYAKAIANAREKLRRLKVEKGVDERQEEP